MKPLLKFFIVVILFTATNTFAAEIQDRKLSGFHVVASTGSFDVVLKQGSSESVKVEADAEVINEIITEVRNGTLTIRSKNTRNWSNIWNNRKITIYVVAKDLNSVVLSGSGDLRMENQFNTNKLELRLSGSGDFKGAVNVKTLEASLSGSGDFSISGKADESTISISGSGDYRGGDLMTKSTAIRVSGSGDANIYTSEKVEASVSGSGDVHYGGHPKSVSKVAHGSGDISGS